MTERALAAGEQWLTVMCGAPASGKTTYTTALYRAHSIVSFDAFRRDLHDYESHEHHLAFRAHVARRLSRGASLTIDATNQDTHERYAWLSLAGLYGAKTSLIVLTCDADTLHNRNGAREHPLPPEQVERCWKRQTRVMHAIRYEPWDRVTIIQTDKTTESAPA